MSQLIGFFGWLSSKKMPFKKEAGWQFFSTTRIKELSVSGTVSERF